MAAKESTGNILDNCLEFAYRWRLNVDIMREPADGDSQVTFIRLRPWQQDKHNEVMYCGWGVDWDKAMRMALKAFDAETSMRLDYAYRPWRTERRGANRATEPIELPF